MNCIRIVALSVVATAIWAGEGKWTPQQVLQLDQSWLKKQGLELPVQRLWDPARGTGLLAAAVNIGGCSAGFVSKDGLILTNHHCLFGVVQEHSRPDRDLITNGFLARTQSEELPSKTTRVTVPRKFTDVTKDIEAAAAKASDDLGRQRAIEDRQKALVGECEKTPGARCRVAAFDGGVSYVLIESFELSDIRLVYAPARAIGEYGGEVDNWMWPRHTGDFAMARAYKDGRPYQPEFYFPLSTRGVKPGDFVMVLGYPGRTMRSLTAAEMADQRDYSFRLRDQVYGEWIRIIEEQIKGNPAAEITMASVLKGYNNVYKNAQGQLAGLKRGHLIEKQTASDDEVMKWAAARPEWAKAVAAKKELDERAEARRKTATRDFLLSVLNSGPMALRQATQLVRAADERTKPDLERDTAYMNRELARMRDRLERDQKSFYQPVDEAILKSWLKRVNEAGVRLNVDVAALYGSTKVTTLAERLKMFSETTEQLKARHDALLDLAFQLDPILRAYQKETREHEGAVARLRPEWRRAVIAHAGKPVAPDANSTLRVSFAHVKGYVPRDGVVYTPQTTLAGMIEKNTGEEPFAMPKALLEAAAKVKTEAIPLDFLADADTTGGNSGSPVVNGRGELVGLNFDRVWENVANDFGYNPDIARNVNVDVRFLLWLLGNVDHADGLVKELTGH